jgi:Cysteine-rich CPXCG
VDFLQSRQVTCPHCWESVDLTFDLSVAGQTYFEDCPVCCQPMLVTYVVADGELAEFGVEAGD